MACDSMITVSNAAPSATWIAVQPSADGVAEITLWIRDLEGDPVDLDARWRLASDDAEGTNLDLLPASHGTVGLTTDEARFESAGQPHLLLWDVTDVPAQESVELVFVPDDKEGGIGAQVRTPAFSHAEGLPSPVILAP